MKLIVTIHLLLVFVGSTLAQSNVIDSVKADYFGFKMQQKNNYPYISLYVTKGRKLQNHYFYYKTKNDYKLALFQRDTPYVKEWIFKTDTLFKEINNHLSHLRKYMKFSIALSKDLNMYNQSLTDTSSGFEMYAIKYKSLHYNHFTLLDSATFNNLKSEDVKKGLEIINIIGLFFKSQYY